MTKNQIAKRVNFWQEKMGLINWSITISFKDSKHPTETENFKGIARTSVQASYKMASIFFAPKYLQMVDDSVIVHELLHCLLGELIGYKYANVVPKKGSDWLEYFEEQVVSELERIILRIYKAKK